MQDNTNTNTNSSVQDNGIKTSINFMKAIENNDLDALNTILENEPISKVTLSAGLMKALQNYRSNSDSIEIIDALLNNNADPNTIVHYKNTNSHISSQDKVTILMYACHKGDIQLVDTILKHNPNVNMRDVNNRNALFYAINADKGDNADIVMLLINSGINVNDPEKDGNVTGNSPLTLATLKNMRNTVRILLDNGANPDWIVTKDENTALHYAVNNCNIEIIKKLLSKNANLKAINKDNVTPLALALKLSHTDIYKLLCEEHNKIVNREKEIANDLITEEENNNTNNNNSSGKSKKKKSPKEEIKEETHQENKENRDHKTNENTLQIKPNEFNINVITAPISSYQKIPNQYSTSDSNINKKNKNTKLELISKIKDYKQANYIQGQNNNRLNIQANNKSQSNYNSNTQNNSSSSTCGLEIPFEFCKKLGDSAQLNSYIKLKSTPTLYLDFSNKSKEDAAILNGQLNELNIELDEKNKKIKMLEDNINVLNEEIHKLKKDNVTNTELISSKEKFINDIHMQWKMKEDQYVRKIEELTGKLENTILYNKELSDKIDKVEKEILEITAKTNSEFLNNQKIKELAIKKDYLDKKFSTSKYEDKYIIKCLQKDILDFQDFTKEQIRRNKGATDELVKLVQAAVNECIPDYEVKLYGSHATSLCLPWSDLDMVLVNKRTQYSSNYGVLQTLYLNLYDKPWKRSIKFIDTAVIPIIKITAADEFNSLQMDISLQDGKHYGLKCVELVKSFMNEYEALEPLIFALKNLLKNANLNDPYTGGLSSYGLILMVVSYLQSQLEGNKPIKIADGNIGRLFLEFLCYYGLIFDHTKYVIYTYPPADLNYVDKDNNNFFFNMQSGHELIIVDPLNKSNNVARSTYQFVNIKMAFMIGFVVSREECECGCHFNNNNEDCIIPNTDHCILKRIFNSVKRFNANANN